MKSLRISLLLILSTIASLSFSQTILNGSFEDWLDSCATDVPPTNWTNFSSDGRGPDQRGLFCEGNITAFDGDHYMALVGCAGSNIIYEGAEQQISGLIPGETYTVSFYAIVCDYTPYAADLNISAYIDSTPVYQTEYLVQNDPWKPFQFTFVANHTTADLAFLCSDWGNYCTLASLGIDKVSIHHGALVSEEEESLLQLYPNPASDRLFIRNADLLTSEIVIYDLVGHVVLRSKMTEQGIDISQLNTGTYFVQASDGKSISIPFVKY